MDPTLKAVCFLVAVILFIIDALAVAYREGWRIGLTSLGLAFFAFPFMWDAFEAA